MLLWADPRWERPDAGAHTAVQQRVERGGEEEKQAERA